MADELERRTYDAEEIVVAIRLGLHHSAGPEDTMQINDGELAALCDEIDRLRTQLALKDKALRHCEWRGPEMCCPFCDQHEYQGHSKTCGFPQALHTEGKSDAALTTGGTDNG